MDVMVEAGKLELHVYINILQLCMQLPVVFRTPCSLHQHWQVQHQSKPLGFGGRSACMAGLLWQGCCNTATISQAEQIIDIPGVRRWSLWSRCRDEIRSTCRLQLCSVFDQTADDQVDKRREVSGIISNQSVISSFYKCPTVQ